MSTINALLELEALAELIQQKAAAFKEDCRRERRKLEGVSTPSSARKGLTALERMNIVSRRRIKTQTA